MKKWFLKNYDSILKTIVAGVALNAVTRFMEILPKSVIEHKGILFHYLDKFFNFPITLKLYHIILFTIIWLVISGMYSKLKHRNQRLRILAAKYFTETRSVDIKNELNNSIEHDHLKIVLSNNIAGDPHPGVVKRGSIKYKMNGKVYKGEYGEGEVIQIP